MKHCSQCGAELLPEWPDGHCLNCFLQMGLAAAEAPQPQTEGTAEPSASEEYSPQEKPGDRIGRYKLVRKLGEGGMGAVYLAEQREPVVRKVALKIIKLGMDTRLVVA